MEKAVQNNRLVAGLSAIILVALIALGVLLAQRDADQVPTALPSAEVPATPQSEATGPDAGSPGASGAEPANPEATQAAEPNQAASPEVTQLPGYEQLERRLDTDPLALGDVSAPIVMVAYSDYQCGYCARWSAETLPELLPYIDSGRLRIEWRDANIFGEDSARGAKAAYAAGLQGAYLEYHERLFTGAQTQDLSEAALLGYAQELGLDTEQFAADFAAQSTDDAVLRNQFEASQIGVTSTPSFIVGGIALVGAQPAEVFHEVIAVAQELRANSAS